MTLSEHWMLDGSVIEEGIVLERPSRQSVKSNKRPAAALELAEA